MSVAEKLTTVADNTDRVFHAGSAMGYQGGYNDGHADGYGEGFAVGETKGYATGHVEGYGAGHEKGLEEGYTEGEASGRAECVSKHFAQIIPGSGTTELTFNVPFKVDILSIICNDPDIRTIKHAAAYFDVDLEALGQLVGKGGWASAENSGYGSYRNSLYSATNISQKFSQADDGTVTVKNVVALEDGVYKEAIFMEGIDYLVVAARSVSKKPVKTRIEESVARISDTGKWTVWYQIEKLKEAYGDDYANNAEWTALIATKPNATFALI